MVKSINIAIIDDDNDDHLFVREALAKLNIEVGYADSFYNGRQFFDFVLTGGYKEAKDLKLDFIILDLEMPILNGIEFLREIKQHPELNQVPVFILTDSGASENKSKCLSLGCAGFYKKTERTKILQEHLREMAALSTAHFKSR